MGFDIYQTEFPTKTHEKIWRAAVLMYPFEMSTDGITDKALLEGFRQVYDFTAEYYLHVYNNIGEYEQAIREIHVLSDEQDGAANIISFIFSLYLRAVHTSITNEWLINDSENDRKIDNMLDLTAAAGMRYTYEGGLLKIWNEKYTSFIKYFSVYCEALVKRKSYVTHRITSCNFKSFTKKGMKVDDAIRAYPDADKAAALKIHNYLTEKGIKPRLSSYSDMAYEYKKELVLYINCSPRFDVVLHTRSTYKTITKQIAGLPNETELRIFMRDKLNYCVSCASPNTQKTKCIDRLRRISLGEENVVCRHDLIVKNDGKNGCISETEIEMILQILDLHISAI
jgi:hypothetical protein